MTTLNITKGDVHEEYRFFAYSINGENGLQDVPNSRNLEDVNFIVIIGEYVENSNIIYLEANSHYVVTVV